MAANWMDETPELPLFRPRNHPRSARLDRQIGLAPAMRAYFDGGRTGFRPAVGDKHFLDRCLAVIVVQPVAEATSAATSPPDRMSPVCSAMNPLVSTIIPVYNRAAMLREAVASVLAQTYRPLEILIVNDGSTDDTATVCQLLAEAHPDCVRVLHQSNAGPGVARETGRRSAQGDFLQYLDSDDLLLPSKFERQVVALRQQPECGIAYCFTRYYRIGEKPCAHPWKGSGSTVETLFPTFLNDRWWDTPTPLYRRTVCEKAGSWSDLRLEEDWEYDCRIAALGTRLVHCREFLVEVRDHGGPRLSRETNRDPQRMRYRAQAHQQIYQHACRAGIRADNPHMQRFARKLFLLARQCGAAGMALESHELFDLARAASGPRRSAWRRFSPLSRRLLGTWLVALGSPVLLGGSLAACRNSTLMLVCASKRISTMTPTVSVVLSVFNDARYVFAAVKSVLTQTGIDLELIAVNDGSTDASGQLLDELAGTDRRVRVIHQENQGLTKGEYWDVTRRAAHSSPGRTRMTARCQDVWSAKYRCSKAIGRWPWRLVGV